MPDGAFPRPAFIDAIGQCVQPSGQARHAPHWQCSSISSGAHELGSTLSRQTLYQELNDKFLVLRVDAASGVSFYDAADEQELLKVCHLADRIASKGQRLGDLQRRSRRPSTSRCRR